MCPRAASSWHSSAVGFGILFENRLVKISRVGGVCFRINVILRVSYLANCKLSGAKKELKENMAIKFFVFYLHLDYATLRSIIFIQCEYNYEQVHLLAMLLSILIEFVHFFCIANCSLF